MCILAQQRISWFIYFYVLPQFFDEICGCFCVTKDSLARQFFLCNFALYKPTLAPNIVRDFIQSDRQVSRQIDRFTDRQMADRHRQTLAGNKRLTDRQTLAGNER
jgi:hypothetical protein